MRAYYTEMSNARLCQTPKVCKLFRNVADIKTIRMFSANTKKKSLFLLSKSKPFDCIPLRMEMKLNLLRGCKTFSIRVFLFWSKLMKIKRKADQVIWSECSNVYVTMVINMKQSNQSIFDLMCTKCTSCLCQWIH